MVIIKVVIINSLKGMSLLDFSIIMFEIEIAETPNKNVTIGMGNSKKMPNKANAGARHKTHRLIIENKVAPAVDEMIADSFLYFSLNIENIMERIIKMAVRNAGTIKSHLGWNSCVIFVSSFSIIPIC